MRGVTEADSLQAQPLSRPGRYGVGVAEAAVLFLLAVAAQARFFGREKRGGHIGRPGHFFVALAALHLRFIQVICVREDQGILWLKERAPG
jgi:hypothetical protein